METGPLLFSIRKGRGGIYFDGNDVFDLVLRASCLLGIYYLVRG